MAQLELELQEAKVKFYGSLFYLELEAKDSKVESKA